MDSRYKELETLISKFVRTLPEGVEYEKRLEEELELIAKLGFAKHFLRVVEILDLTKDIPHMTRGSVVVVVVAAVVIAAGVVVAAGALLCWRLSRSLSRRFSWRLT